MLVPRCALGLIAEACHISGLSVAKRTSVGDPAGFVIKIAPCTMKGAKTEEMICPESHRGLELATRTHPGPVMLSLGGIA